MKLRNLLLITLVFAGHFSHAQISQGGIPLAFESGDRYLSVPAVTVVPENLEALKAEDAVNDQYKDIPYRFGAKIPVSLTLEDGEWEMLKKGNRVWRLAINSPGATSINFNFSTFNIPEGGAVFVYDADQTQYIGSFTHKNMQPHGGLGVSLIHSDHIIIEYFEPAAVAGQGVLEIDYITHGYRGLLLDQNAARGPFGNSGSCNINVACDEGIGWEDQIRSVALIIVGGNAHCTGSLVNNTAQNGTPYFLTANHCLTGTEGSWVFYFNHQASTCQGNTGPTNQSVSGAQLRASNQGSDVALLELNSIPPANYNVFYNGWDRTGNTPLHQTGIHHPSGDLKKISHDHDPATQSVNGGAQTWLIGQWEEGTTEGGSSGSPLYDHNGRVIGQLYGGAASCNNISIDYYGRFDVSWDGPNASSRLRDWLDPLNLDVQIWDGLGGAPLLANDASAMGINGLSPVFCDISSATPVFTLRNNGTEDLTSAVIELTLNGNSAGTIEWSGNLTSGQTEAIQLPELTFINGINNLSVTITQPNGGVDDNPANNTSTFEFSVFLDAVEYEVEIVLDSYGSETSWTLFNENGTELYSGGSYADPNPWGSEGTDGQLEEHTLCLGAGCYTFEIYDQAGDGICCGYGNGSYTLFDHLGNEVFTGGNFGVSNAHDFCVTTVSIDEATASSGFSVFPNPAASSVTLQLNETYTGSTDISISDITGRVMMRKTLSQMNRQSINVENWAEGVYFIQVENGDQRSVERFVISR